MLIAFELQYYVDDVFQYFWAGNASFFVDVPNEQDGNTRSFTKFEQNAKHIPRTCDTEPGEDSIISVESVWIESTILHL